MFAGCRFWNKKELFKKTGAWIYFVFTQIKTSPSETDAELQVGAGSEN